jgi:hypothetical protein
MGPLAFSCGAFLETRVASCYKRYMPVPAVTTPVREHLSEILFDKVYIGPQWLQTPRTSCDTTKAASSMLDKLTSRRRRSRPSPSHGLRRVPPLHGQTALTSARGLHSAPHSGRQVLQVDRGSTIVNVRSEEVVSFFTDIIYHFGIPNTIITDNAPSSRGRNSSTSATTTTSVWTSRLLLTQRRTDKSRGQTT